MLETNIHSLREGILIGSGLSHLLSSHTTSIHVLEIEDVFFRDNSAVVMPDPAEDASGTVNEEEVITGLAVLKTTFIRLKEFPTQKLLVVGHTDTKGSESFNFTLSEERAASLVHLLEGNRAEWVEIAIARHVNKDVQQILKWAAGARSWDCDPGEVDGDIGSETRRAIRGFQEAYNLDFGQAIDENGRMSRQVWGAMFDVYQAELALLLDDEEEGLARYRADLRWLDAARKGVGCGESWPIEAAEQNNYRSARNRRVELLFFDADESLLLDCHPPGATCIPDLCPLYPPRRGSRIYLPVHPHPRPQSTPTFFTIEQPGATNHVRMHSLIAYVAYFNERTELLEQVHRFRFHEGKLCGFATDRPVPIDCDREAWFYFSHRDDLLHLDRATQFSKDGSGLPLLGPIRVPCGGDARIELDIWQQRDWVIVRGVRVDGERPDVVRMAEWREDYTIGWHGFMASGEAAFSPYGDSRQKDRQERWKGGSPIDLVHLGNPGTDPMWAGTLSALPAPRAKILLMHNPPSGGPMVVGSFQELRPTGANQDLRGHHTFDNALIQRLAALRRDSPPTSAVDALPNPPARHLLGDMCWQDQGQTNNCGPYSFSTAMNYWFPYTNNPARKNGALYAQRGNVDDLINGARTPRNIVEAARRFRMNGEDHDAEDLDRARTLKLLKLWISAGVPVLILVKEEYTVSSYHWKTVVGYDGNRFFMNNSGADFEIIVSRRQPGIQYEQAPVGNDVDSEAAFYNKWRAAGGDIVDAITSVDRCTFIPLYPTDAMFASTSAR